MSKDNQINNPIPADDKDYSECNFRLDASLHVEGIYYSKGLSSF